VACGTYVLIDPLAIRVLEIFLDNVESYMQAVPWLRIKLDIFTKEDG